MSIVSLSKVTFYGHGDDKTSVLEDLQELGCLHIIPLTPERSLSSSADGPSSQAREALRYLLSCPRKRRQVSDSARFDAVAVEERALAIQRLVHTLGDEQDYLEERIRDMRPWGDFSMPPLDAFGGFRLWLYRVPLHDVTHIPASETNWEIVARDNRFAFVAAVSKHEPQGMPVQRTQTGRRSLYQLEQRLEEVELELEDLQAERTGLTRWCHLYASLLFQLEDREAVLNVTKDTFDLDPLFAVQGWTPSPNVPKLSEYAEKNGLALEVEAPGPKDDPPTLLRNEPTLASGQDLVSFYMTPNYRLWDPSLIVFFSFSIFFAMIISDVGYAAVMAVGLVLGWKKMGGSDSGRRFRILFATLIGTSTIWGVLVGSYFGYSPQEDTILGDLNLLSLNNFDGMMKLSIFIGVGHLVLANLADMVRRGRSPDALVPVGWIALFIGAVMLGLSGDESSVDIIGTAMGRLGVEVSLLDQQMKTAGGAAMISGALAVLFFTPASGPFYKRLMAGFMALLSVSSAFGDTLSYLRLFALGLASASLAVAFNDLADQVRSAAGPGFGLLFGMIVFLIGHTLNFVLGIVSGFIHGLRLNYIEFFNWSIPEEGRPFRAFSRKEA